MTTLDTGTTGLAGEVFELVATRAASDQELFSDTGVREAAVGWGRVIDKLLDWLNDPCAMEDEDFLPPSGDLIKRVCDFAIGFRDEQLPSPLRIVPDGDEGISFEWRRGVFFETINFDADGAIEWLQFEDCKLVRRIPLG